MLPIKLPGPSSRSPKPKQIPYTLPSNRLCMQPTQFRRTAAYICGRAASQSNQQGPALFQLAMTSFPLPPQGERKARAKHREAWSDPSTERLGLIGHGVILSDTKGNTCPKSIKIRQKRLACVGSEQYRVRLVKPVMHGKLCMLQRFKSQRGMCEPCARSLKVSGILTGRGRRLDVL